MDWQSESEPAQLSTECRLGDLSRGGIRFLTPAPPPRAGTTIHVTLLIPGEAEPLRLRGSVVWTLVSSGQHHNVAMAFSPYGTSPGENDPAALDRLVAIEARFLAAAP